MNLYLYFCRFIVSSSFNHRHGLLLLRKTTTWHPQTLGVMTTMSCKQTPSARPWQHGVQHVFLQGLVNSSLFFDILNIIFKKLLEITSPSVSMIFFDTTTTSEAPGPKRRSKRCQRKPKWKRFSQRQVAWPRQNDLGRGRFFGMVDISPILR